MTTPVTTDDPDGDGTSSPGNITIDANGNVKITSAGAAVTINSDNTVTNTGTIGNTSDSGAVGIHVLGGFTGNLQDADHRPIGITGTGTISIIPVDTDPTKWGPGNTAILIDGAGNFTGDIDLDSMRIAVVGPGAVGLAINTGVVGNVRMGQTTATGDGASALRTTATIDGVLSFNASIGAQGTTTFSTTGFDPHSGPTIAIGGNVTGGILNLGPTDDDDEDHESVTISQIGPAPAVEISPTVAGIGAADITIGILDDADNPGFSFINRGFIGTVSNDPGISTTAILIGRADDSDPGLPTATLTGGIYNRGTIQAIATTGNAGATEEDPANADATAIHITAGGSVPEIVNDAGGKVIAATQGGPQGGTATAILIDEGGTLTSLVNNGGITATASTTAVDGDTISDLSAIAIWDKSGTLTSVTNTGLIGAASLAADGVDITNRHILIGDFSANTTTLTFTNSGTISGDIVFGAGTSQFTIDGDDAVVSGAYHAAAGGALDVTVANGSFTTADTVGRNFAVGNKGTVHLAVVGTGNADPAITMSGDAHFDTGSQLAVSYSQLVGDHASFALMHADGTVSFDDVAGTTAGSTPFLYKTEFQNDGHDLTLDLTRKTSAELGLTGDQAALYEPAIAAIVAADAKLGSALMSLTDQQSTLTAFESMTPLVNGAQRNYAIALTDMFFGPVGARQRTLVSTPNQGHNLAFWGQEFYLANQNDGDRNAPGYADSGFGVAAGMDYGSLSTGRYGVAFEHFNGDSVEGEPRVNKTVNNWTVFSLYADWADADSGLFLTTQGAFGFGSFDSKRRILVGDYTPNAKGHWTGWVTAGGIAVGDVIGDDTFAIIPQADLDAMYMSESEYTEGGPAGGARLHVGGRSTTSLRGFVGVVGRAQFEFAGGYVRPELHIGWTHEFAGRPADANVYFVSAQNMHFKISGPAEPVSKFVGGGSLSFVYNNWSVGGDYDTTIGSNTSSDAGSLTVTGHF